MRVEDTFARPLRNLRISVTDRCNLRCAYCMPEEEYVWLPREEILHFEEISRLVDVFIELGVDKVRLTGGEPLLRRDLPALIEPLAAKPGLRDLAITTNGVHGLGTNDEIDRVKRPNGCPDGSSTRSRSSIRAASSGIASTSSVVSVG